MHPIILSHLAQNDLGIGPEDHDGMIANLRAQGINDIKSLSLSGNFEAESSVSTAAAVENNVIKSVFPAVEGGAAKPTPVASKDPRTMQQNALKSSITFWI